MERWGRGAGRRARDVVELIEEYKRLSKMMSKMKGLKGAEEGGYGNQQAMNQNLAQMAQAIPPQMLKQMGGMGALQSMMKQLEGKDMGQMQQMMQKMGGEGDDATGNGILGRRRRTLLYVMREAADE